MNKGAILSVIFTFAAPWLSAQTTRVLFIGNSYTYVNDLPELTRQLALSLGDTIEVASSTPGGYTFQGHTTNATTQALIAQGNWDFVVLQEQSQLPSFPPSQVDSESRPFAQALVDSIRAYSPCAEPVFYMTWGRQNGDAQNCASWPPVCTYEGMQQQLRTAYLSFAVENQVCCAPVGVAWATTRAQEPSINLYAGDGSHPSLEGSYLAACAMYSTFFRTTTVNAPYVSTLNATTAATLQMIASNTVVDSSATWNIGASDPVAIPSHSDAIGGTVDLAQTSLNTTTHFWDLGDGSTSTDPSFSHTYNGPGYYEVVYVASDDCGRSDTALFEIDYIVFGIDELASPLFTVTSFGSSVMVRNEGLAGVIEFFDMAGRSIMQLRVPSNSSISATLSGSSTYTWRFLPNDGRLRSGKLLVQ